MSSYDNDRAFESVLHKTGNIDSFIDDFFSFLARRTDFFMVSNDEQSKFGFPPGVAAKLIISKFKKWESFISPSGQNELQITKTSDKTSASSELKSAGIKSKKESESGESIPNKEDNKLAKLEKGKVGEFSCHNGRKTDKYSWSQTIKDLDVAVVVGGEVKTKRDIRVEITTRNIKIVVPSSAEPTLVDWSLPNPIVKDESYWSLHPGESVFLSLQKTQEKWWDHLFEGEETLDRNKIEAVRPMEELDEEEQAKIQELVWNQEQKLKGLPTSEELKLQEIMKKAWDVDGSPFKGQPFDPSRVTPANNSINFLNSQTPTDGNE